jgi:hypothetical protein
MLLKEEEWRLLFQHRNILYNFIDDWNNNCYAHLSDVLREALAFADDAAVFFFWGRDCGVETTWAVFLKYWINFLFDDEGSILINPDSHRTVIFGPDGSVITTVRVDLL